MSRARRVRDLWPQQSLGWQITLVAAANGFLLLVGLLLLFRVSERGRVQIEAAAGDFVEETRIAERINEAVMDQLVAVSVASSSGNDRAIRRSFVEAGDVVNQQTRLYLRRDLTPAERLELERLREEHQRLEVAAAHAFEVAGTSVAQADAARRGVFDAASALRDALSDFLGLRERAVISLAEQQRDLLGALRAGAIALLVLMLAGMLLFARFLHRRLTTPLHELAIAAARIGAGEPGARVEPRHDDDLGHLADTFNAMAGSVADARRVLELRNAELGEALQRLRDAQADLVQTEKLGALGRMIAGLAHELNNPLASVLGHSELLAARLADGDVPDERELREEFVEPVVVDAARARDLVRNLLQFSRRSAPELQAVPLRQAVDVVAGLRRYAFEHAGLQLHVDVPDVHVLAERQRLQQVCLNLVNNALEAMTAAGRTSGALDIRATRQDGYVVVVFDDDGPGVSRPDRVFDPFYTTKDVGDGTGLGLTLVHGFVEEFGGDIRVENRPDGGARFTVRLYAADAPPASAPERTTNDALVAEPIRAAPGAEAPRILIVEDEAPIRRLQEQILRRAGATVFLAESGNEGRRFLAVSDVDVVVSDVKMPDGSGVELYDWIRRERPELGERVLLVTGNLGDPAVIEISDSEPHRVLAKPFSREEYLTRVMSLVALKGAGGETEKVK
ncbi:MAG TPA: ATP-binding protein [Longimicrobiales bacterium]